MIFKKKIIPQKISIKYDENPVQAPPNRINNDGITSNPIINAISSKHLIATMVEI